MGKRGKDKRTEEKRKEFHDMINNHLHNDLISFIKLDDGTVVKNFLISSLGLIYEIDTVNNKIIMKRPYMEKDLHLRIGINYDGNHRNKKFFVHKLVALAFVDNPENKEMVHHIDGNPFNNHYKNLMWVTDEEHKQLTAELQQYQGLRGSNNSSATCTDEQIELAFTLIEENEKYPDEICKEANISYSVFQHLLHRDSAWDYIKEKYDISNYNKFRRKTYTDEQKQDFIYIRESHPEYSLRKISKLMDIKYETIKTWNARYFLYSK